MSQFRDSSRRCFFAPVPHLLLYILALLLILEFLLLTSANASSYSFRSLGGLSSASNVNSQASGISADGNVVVGWATGFYEREAFRWTASGGMVSLGVGDLTGGQRRSEGVNVSADGSVIVGYSTRFSRTEAFRWTDTSGMVGLGDLSGGSFGSFADAISADGSVAVGYANLNSGSTVFEAFRWTSASGMVGL